MERLHTSLRFTIMRFRLIAGVGRMVIAQDSAPQS
jgi:hypothetical protein